MNAPIEVARTSLGSDAGEFELRAYECSSGSIYLVLLKGTIGAGLSVLTRIHSECLTGDALGSMKCDCGLQLRNALRAIGQEGCGVLVYATGQEGRGVGLLNKLRAYMLQESGYDTVDANHLLGLPADARDYREAAQCLALVGVRSVRLLTNNPAKVSGLRANGIEVDQVLSALTSPNARNTAYLRSKRDRLGHTAASAPVPETLAEALDASGLLGAVREPSGRPYVVLKYAQTLDGRIATRTGDSKWITGEDERRISHALRAACDAVLVGVDTVLNDDPQLTVRMVTGASPLRIVLDSTLRLPRDAKVLDGDARTMVICTNDAPVQRRLDLLDCGVAVHAVRGHPAGVDIDVALRLLRGLGIRSVLVEGGARVLTSFLKARLADRVIVGVAPMILGAGTDAFGDLDVASVMNGFRIKNQTVFRAGEDLLLAGDLEPVPPGSTPDESPPVGVSISTRRRRRERLRNGVVQAAQSVPAVLTVPWVDR
jgi:3,4-dihydroxy 2-butanone 4-phosphate synthase/GTP cyclohydrolase II